MSKIDGLYEEFDELTKGYDTHVLTLGKVYKRKDIYDNQFTTCRDVYYMNFTSHVSDRNNKFRRLVSKLVLEKITGNSNGKSSAQLEYYKTYNGTYTSCNIKLYTIFLVKLNGKLQLNIEPSFSQVKTIIWNKRLSYKLPLSKTIRVNTRTKNSQISGTGGKLTQNKLKNLFYFITSEGYIPKRLSRVHDTIIKEVSDNFFKKYIVLDSIKDKDALVEYSSHAQASFDEKTNVINIDCLLLSLLDITKADHRHQIDLTTLYNDNKHI